MRSEAPKNRPELSTVALPVAAVLAILGVLTAFTAPQLLPRLYFVREDGFVLAVLGALLLLFRLPRLMALVPVLRDRAPTQRQVIVGAAALALLLWAGTYLLFGNYSFSRDEQMVVFDTQVFREGWLAAPVPPQWRNYAVALAPAFLLPLPGSAAWVSSYLPGNAMLRTLFGAVLDPALLNPLLAAAGAVATFDCARRIFPDSRGAQSIALLMYATSAQVLVTAMTPFAMTGHLALNMIWLALYLRGSRAAHAVAIAIGFIAIGLHQVIFHPLFVLPFLEHLRRQAQWRTALVYLACYTVFGLFWISYPHLVAISAGLQSQAGSAAGTGGFIAERVLPLLAHREPQTIPLMQANLLRFVTWENLALVPLMVLGFGAIRRGEGIARPLAAGIVLTFVAMALLLPYQAIGWGYRYLHGLIGACALLAGYGWREAGDRALVGRYVTAATAATLVFSIPFLMWRAESFVRPYARVNAMIDRIDADMVVIEAEGPVFRIDEVRNRPDLANRPLRLASTELRTADMAVLCSRGTIAFVDAGEMQALGLGLGYKPASTHFQDLRDAAARPCTAKS